MNLINLCLRIPNLGIILYYLIFVVIIPYILVANANLDILKYYMPLMVGFANLLTLSGDKKLFGNLYQLQPTNFVGFVSTNFINLFALFGILWQCIDYSNNNNGNITKSIVYGTVLFVIIFPFSRQGLKFVVDHVDFYMREKTKMKYEYNWHMLTFGLLYIIFLLGLQAVILSLISGTTDYSGMKLPQAKKKPKAKPTPKLNANVNQTSNANQVVNANTNANAKVNNVQDRNNESKINTLVNNIKKNITNGTNNVSNNTQSLLNNISISNLNNFAKKRGLTN